MTFCEIHPFSPKTHHGCVACEGLRLAKEDVRAKKPVPKRRRPKVYTGFEDDFDRRHEDELDDMLVRQTVGPRYRQIA